jgi:hypothetical protein
MSMEQQSIDLEVKSFFFKHKLPLQGLQKRTQHKPRCQPSDPQDRKHRKVPCACGHPEPQKPSPAGTGIAPWAVCNPHG